MTFFLFSAPRSFARSLRDADTNRRGGGDKYKRSEGGPHGYSRYPGGSVRVCLSAAIGKTASLLRLKGGETFDVIVRPTRLRVFVVVVVVIDRPFDRRRKGTDFIFRQPPHLSVETSAPTRTERSAMA